MLKTMRELRFRFSPPGMPHPAFWKPVPAAEGKGGAGGAEGRARAEHGGRQEEDQGVGGRDPAHPGQQ